MSSVESRQCYICLDSEGEGSEWISPCNCTGSLKWVHQECLTRWVRNNMAAHPESVPVCSQCKTKLWLVPEQGVIVSIIEYIDTTVAPLWKYGMACIFGYVAFKTASQIIGISAQSQVYGLDDTLNCLKKIDTESALKLHFTTFMLVAVNALPWDRYLLKGLRELSSVPVLQTFLPEPIPVRFRLPEDFSISRIVINSLLLPFFASTVGNYCFRSVNSPLNKALLGGLLFLGVKGFFSMFILQRQEVRRKRMVILPYRATLRSSFA